MSIVVELKGIEPLLEVCGTSVLPLYDSPVSADADIHVSLSLRVSTRPVQVLYWRELVRYYKAFPVLLFISIKSNQKTDKYTTNHVDTPF